MLAVDAHTARHSLHEACMLRRIDRCIAAISDHGARHCRATSSSAT